ncbi:MAG: hypothetical protein JXA73_03165 [Acidobacteria bacterium]|nr:hypothetical protein [Acidobacteriota bacterium]
MRKVLSSEYPNPNRIGCPDRKIIRDLAFHKKAVDSETFGQISLHMFKCSECYRDTLRFVEEYKKERKQRRVRIALTIAASIVIAVALWGIWQFQPSQEIVGKPVSAPQHPPVSPLIAENSTHKNTKPEIARYEPVLIELPTRWRGAAGSPEQPIAIKRGRLQLEVRLPIGSPEGKYKLRILDKAEQVRNTAEGIAPPVNGTTSFRVEIDSSNLPPGNYELSILEPGLDEWTDYHVSVK